MAVPEWLWRVDTLSESHNQLLEVRLEQSDVFLVLIMRACPVAYVLHEIVQYKPHLESGEKDGNIVKPDLSWNVTKAVFVTLNRICLGTGHVPVMCRQTCKQKKTGQRKELELERKGIQTAQ